MHVFVTFLILMVLMPQRLLAGDVVRLTTGEWSPYISEALDKDGLLVQLTTEAFALKGYKVKIGFFPWARATELSKSGEWDGTIAFVHLPERETIYHYSDMLYVGRYVFFHLKSFSFSWNSYADLKSIPMASTRGFGGMGEAFLEAERSGAISVSRYTSDIQSFKMLKGGRIKAVPSDLEVGYVLLRKIFGDDSGLFTHNTKAILSSEYHLVISKKSKRGEKLIRDFNEGLRELRKMGRYDEIVRSWYDRPIYRDAVPKQFLLQPKDIRAPSGRSH